MSTFIAYWPTPVFSGVILLLTWALTLVDAFRWLETTALATFLAWSYLILELPRLSSKQRKPVIILWVGGCLFAAAAWYTTSALDIVALGSEYLMLIMLLTSVNFIRLATKLYGCSTQRGFSSYLATFTGMHLLSSVANLSSLTLVGDQIRQPNHQIPGLSPLSYSLLSRSFALAIFWSPFLTMIPLVTSQIPSLDMSLLYPWTLSIVAFGFIFTFMEAKLRFGDELTLYQGYPIRPSSLWLPMALIISVLLSHLLAPEMSMTLLVSVLAVIIPVVFMLVSQPLSSSIQALSNQIQVVLPNARPEISLFLSAGFMASAVKSCIAAGLISLPLTETNAIIASLAMFLVFVIAGFGIHQFALVAIFAGLLDHATTTPTLMGLGYMVGVSVAMSSSLFSGVNFILQGQYNLESREILRLNLPYSIAMLTFATLILFIMEANGIR